MVRIVKTPVSDNIIAFVALRRNEISKRREAGDGLMRMPSVPC